MMHILYIHTCIRTYIHTYIHTYTYDVYVTPRRDKIAVVDLGGLLTKKGFSDPQAFADVYTCIDKYTHIHMMHMLHHAETKSR